MWIDKLAGGVLRVVTPLGPRYIELSFSQRIYVLWMFRHFDTLPQVVLSKRQQQLIDDLCAEHRFISWPRVNGIEDAPVIGTVEKRPPAAVEGLAPPESSASVGDATMVPLVADLRQRS